MEDSLINSSEEALSIIMMKLLDCCLAKKPFQQVPPHRVKQQESDEIKPTPESKEPETQEQPKSFGDDMYTPEPPDDDDNLDQEKEEDAKNTILLFKDEMYTPTGDDQEPNENIGTEENEIENNDNQNTISLTKKPNNFGGIEIVLHIKNLHSHHDVWSPIVLKDNKIATVGSDGFISISKVDYKKKTSVQVISKKAEQNSVIQSICELDDGRLITASGDMTIKVW